MNAVFNPDNVVLAIKLVSTLTAALFGTTALFGNVRDRKGRLTRTGKIAVAGIVLSFVCSTATVIGEEFVNRKGSSLELSKLSEIDASNEQIILQTNRAMFPFVALGTSFTIVFSQKAPSIKPYIAFLDQLIDSQTWRTAVDKKMGPRPYTFCKKLSGSDSGFELCEMRWDEDVEHLHLSVSVRHGTPAWKHLLAAGLVSRDEYYKPYDPAIAPSLSVSFGDPTPGLGKADPVFNHLPINANWSSGASPASDDCVYDVSYEQAVSDDSGDIDERDLRGQLTCPSLQPDFESGLVQSILDLSCEMFVVSRNNVEMRPVDPMDFSIYSISISPKSSVVTSEGARHQSVPRWGMLIEGNAIRAVSTRGYTMFTYTLGSNDFHIATRTPIPPCPPTGHL